MKIKEKFEDFKVEELIDLDLSGGDYVYLKITKKNLNTMDVIKELTKVVDRKSIGFAGLKDKKAITTQYVSLKTNKKYFNFNNFDVEVIGRGPKPISLGDLKGNKFKIKIDFMPKEILHCVNYYGEQRFSINNVDVGRFIIQRKFKEACGLIENININTHLQIIRMIISVL